MSLKILSCEKRIQRLSTAISSEENKLESTLNRRLLVGLVAVLTVFISAAYPENQIGPSIFLVALGVFSFYFIKSRNLRKHLRHLNSWQKYLERTLLRQKGVHTEKHDALPYVDRQAQIRGDDLHLQGPKSLFTYLNNCLSRDGELRLWQLISSPLLDRAQIELRQKTIKGLSQLKWRIEKLLIQNLDFQRESDQEFVHLLQVPVVGGRFYLILILQWALCLGAWGLILASILMGSPTLWWPLVAFFVFALMTRSRLGDVFGKAQQFSKHLGSAMPTFAYLEKYLIAKLPEGYVTQIKASSPHRQIKGVSWILSLLSVQGHPLVHLVTNIMLPWDYSLAYLLEKWRKPLSEKLPKALSELYELEALFSCTLFYCYQTRCFPSLADRPKLQFTELRHPLIDQAKVVANDFSVPDNKKLILITGSNMAGKSTFLRTVGFNQQLALMGCPVYAERMTTFLAPVLTCLRVTDSLEDGFSTFYYEVKQIGEILKQADQGHSFLYLVDEIFRGTNNRERLIGSRAVIEHLAKKDQLIGFISTHDLELSSLEDQQPFLSNWHFGDIISHNKMSFSYKIAPGPCPSTNALRIMENEGLPVKSNIDS